MEYPITHRRLQTNGISLHMAECGAGPPVLLLHGFPVCWYSWKHQLSGLAERGFRVVAPDLRGYGESDAPQRIADYRMRELVADVVGIIDDLGGRVRLVGHDWGGGVAWMVATRHPQRVEKLAILNAPHAARFREAMRRLPRQWLRSWYMFFFQQPWLPEALLQARDFAAIVRAWRTEPRRAGAISDQEITVYKAALRRHGLRGPINYYRAALHYSRDIFSGDLTVRVPTLLLWGEHDPYLDLRLTENLERFVPDLRVERFANASHWLQNDEPEAVNAALAEFFKNTSE